MNLFGQPEWKKAGFSSKEQYKQHLENYANGVVERHAQQSQQQLNGMRNQYQSILNTQAQVSQQRQQENNRSLRKHAIESEISRLKHSIGLYEKQIAQFKTLGESGVAAIGIQIATEDLELHRKKLLQAEKQLKELS